MIKKPTGMGLYEFAVLSSLRAGQLSRGCVPRVAPAGKIATTALLEVAAGKVWRAEAPKEALVEVTQGPIEPAKETELTSLLLPLR